MNKVFIFFLFINSLFFSQKNTVVEYDYIYDKKVINDNLNEFLVISDKENIYLGYGKPNEKLSIESVFTDKFDVRLISYFILHSFDNEMLVLGTKMPPKKILTKDVHEPIKWQLVDGEKDILGFNCKKAQCEFRGRSYVVWYTPEIPSQSGPWKFSGLPGLILEANDSKDIHNYYSRRIILNTDLKIPNTFISYIEEKKKNIIPFETYISKENEYLKEIHNQIKASFPSGTVFLGEEESLRTSQNEVTFEWEEPKKP